MVLELGLCSANAAVALSDVTPDDDALMIAIYNQEMAEEEVRVWCKELMIVVQGLEILLDFAIQFKFSKNLII